MHCISKGTWLSDQSFPIPHPMQTPFYFLKLNYFKIYMYAWDTQVFLFLCLAYSFGTMLSRYIGVVTNGKSLLFLKLNNIPLCVYIHTYICVCIYVCACVCMENMFFILSSVDGCLRCFHVLNSINNAAKSKPLKQQFQFCSFCIQYGLTVFPRGHILETRSLLEQCWEVQSNRGD